MTATLNIVNNFIGTTLMGQPVVGNQGAIGNVATSPVNLAAVSLTGVFGSPTFSGYAYQDMGTLAPATALKIYDNTIHKPATWNYFFVWADQPLYLQFITSATNFTTQILPTVPFVMSVDGVLAAASTSAITGGSTPTLVAVATVYLGNYSGNTANWQTAFIL